MAYLTLYGAGGWTQRWTLADGQEPIARLEVEKVGRSETSRLSIVDDRTGIESSLVVSWVAVAAAVVFGSEPGPPHDEPTGRYA
jgi:hypothetical protein